MKSLKILKVACSKQKIVISLKKRGGDKDGPVLILK